MVLDADGLFHKGFILSEAAVRLRALIFVVVYVATKDDSVPSISLPCLYKVQEIPDLQSDVLTSLEVVDIAIEQFNALILGIDNH